MPHRPRGLLTRFAADDVPRAVAGVVRGGLLWASGNRWLRRHVPRTRFARRAVRRFMPGEGLDDALTAARAFARRDLPTTLTHLGENVIHASEADAVVRHYLEVLDRVAESELDTEISVKLTHLGLDLDQELAQVNLERLLEAARARGNRVWIDMESSEYVDRTVRTYRTALGSWPEVGLCLQAYLHRTAGDLDVLLPHRPSIRLVKGAYREPRTVALGSRREIDANFLRLSERMLRERSRVDRFAAATHDLGLIDRVDEAAHSMGLPRETVEVQMLYGIRQAEQYGLAREGRPVRSLIAYGPAWYPWYVRRLAERPANLGFVLRSLVSRGPVEARLGAGR
jgi:proline dehydrogenase